MAVAFDAGFLILAFDEQAVARLGAPRVKERIELLLADLRKTRTKILIPTPALSEFLAKADFSILQVLHSSAAFKIVPFDERAAIEAAQMTRDSIKESDKKDPVVGATWAKIKFDRQIVATAKVEAAEAIYSTDAEVAKHAQKAGILCYGIKDLPEAPAVQEVFPDMQGEANGTKTP
jgi:predicted nucleic acid-binding protein